jgi:dTDP-4-dehydrorhamnose 3,5-epimerase
MPFIFVPGPLPGLCIIEPKVFGDARGYFMETYSERDFAVAGICDRFVQDNQSKSRRGVLRGLHYQKTFPQGKLVRVISGEVWDVAVDLRIGSLGFGKWFGLILSAENKKQFYVPAGFAHGFVVLSDEAEFTYKCTDFYHPEDEDGICWNDPTIAVAWPGNLSEHLLSEKDGKLPLFDSRNRYFTMDGRPA